MIYAIIGSRGYENYAQFEATLDLKHKDITKIVSGGARGVDSMAERYALEHNIELVVFPADWDRYGKSAGYRRNVDIVNAAEHVIAFWDFQSKGTKHSLNLAQQANKPYTIYLTTAGPIVH